MKKYAMEYYLQNQSKLFSEPQVIVGDKSEIISAIQVAKKCGYEIVRIYEA